MNLSEAIKFLESKGWKVYAKSKNSYSVWSPRQKNNRVDFRCTERELIKLAKSQRKHKSMATKGTTHVGPGGIHCPCCTDYPVPDIKRFTKRRNRRNSLKDIDLE